MIVLIIIVVWMLIGLVSAVIIKTKDDNIVVGDGGMLFLCALMGPIVILIAYWEEIGDIVLFKKRK